MAKRGRCKDIRLLLMRLTGGRLTLEYEDFGCLFWSIFWSIFYSYSILYSILVLFYTLMPFSIQLFHVGDLVTDQSPYRVSWMLYPYPTVYTTTQHNQEQVSGP